MSSNETAEDDVEMIHFRVPGPVKDALAARAKEDGFGTLAAWLRHHFIHFLRERSP